MSTIYHINILHTKYRGETDIRTSTTKEIKFLSTAWHPKEQRRLIAYDADKNAERTFACKDTAPWRAK